MIVWNGIKVDISVRECVWKCWFIYDCEWFSYRVWGMFIMYFCWVVILFCFILSFMLVYIIVEEMNLLSVEFVLVI